MYAFLSQAERTLRKLEELIDEAVRYVRKRNEQIGASRR